MARINNWMIEESDFHLRARDKASIKLPYVKIYKQETGENLNKDKRKASKDSNDTDDEYVDVDISPEEFGKDLTFFLSLDPKKAAWDLRITEWNLFKNLTIEDIEVYGTGISFAINLILQNYDMVFYWTLETVLSGKDAATRSKAITLFIRIAQDLVCYNNFNSSHAILSALQNTPIQRLQKTWAKMTNNKMKMFKNLNNLFSEKDNFYELTQKMDDVNEVNNICVPYFELFLKDYKEGRQSNDDLRIDTLRRVGIVIEDIGKICKFRHEGNSSTLVRSQLIHSMKLSEEKIIFLEAESMIRSFFLEDL